jgi:IS30 family transposase
MVHILPTQKDAASNLGRFRRLDFQTLTQADFDAIAQQLNERPRQTLGFKTPSQALAEVLR